MPVKSSDGKWKWGNIERSSKKELAQTVYGIWTKNGKPGTFSDFWHGNHTTESVELEEGEKDLISVSLLSLMLAVPGIVSGQSVQSYVSDKLANNLKPTVREFQDQVAKDNALKTYGGYTEYQVSNIIARTLWGEAKGESEEGRRYVATAIVNRAGGDLNKIVNVCFKPIQFSMWNSISPSTNPEYKPATYKVIIPSDVRKNETNREIWINCNAIAGEIMQGKFKTKGTYNSYYNPAKAKPKWRTEMTNVLVVGKHKFGYLRDQDPTTGKAGKKPGKKPVKNTASSTYIVQKGDLGVSYIAKNLIASKKTSITDISKLTQEIIRINNLKKDKKGNPIIRVGDKIRLPA